MSILFVPSPIHICFKQLFCKQILECSINFKKLKNYYGNPENVNDPRNPTNIRVQNAEFPGFAKGYKDFFLYYQEIQIK
jgi:hypothetical protein